MLPKFPDNSQVFIEITDLEHGGLGWELGSCLWSPVFDKGGSKAWKLKENASIGDTILHLVDINGQYHWYGISIANSNLIVTNNEPPKRVNGEECNLINELPRLL